LWAPSAFTACYRAFLRRRGLKPARSHTPRHAYGSYLISGGEDITTVSSLFGHSCPSTTVNVYAYLLDQSGQEVAKRIQARIDRTKAAQPSAINWPSKLSTFFQLANQLQLEPPVDGGV